MYIQGSVLTQESVIQNYPMANWGAAGLRSDWQPENTKEDEPEA